VLLDEIDHIYIVNLKSRVDRRREMERQMRRLGLGSDPRVHYFDAIKQDQAGPFLRIGSHGAFLSHLAILKAHEHTNETILILQDDCDFLPGAKHTKVVDEWDILYGGFHQLDEGDLHLSNIQGAHCMAFRPRVISPLAKYLEGIYAGEVTFEKTGDVQSSIAPPIDGAIVWFRRAHPEVRTVFHQISYQRSSKTDIGNPSAIDRFPVLARIFRLALRWARRAALRLNGSPGRQ
jgi:glycosyl transferase family 25